MDGNWSILVKEGKEIAGRKDKDQWHLGDLAVTVKADYGQAKLKQYAQEIGENYVTLKSYRSTASKWPDKKDRMRSFSIARDLNAHPDREKIAQENPGITREEARELVKEWRAQNLSNKPSKKKKSTPPDIPLNNRRQMEEEIERQVADRVSDWMRKFKPHLDDATAVKAGRRGLIDRDEATAITRCLHPDNSAGLEARNKAFIVWRRIEHLLMSEEDAPTTIFSFRRKTA